MSLKNKSTIFFLRVVQLLIVLYTFCISYAEQDFYISFEYSSRYYELLPDIINSSTTKPKSLVFTSENQTWNSHYLKPYKKSSFIKDIKETGSNKGTFIHSIRVGLKTFSKSSGPKTMDNLTEDQSYTNLSIPQVMKIEDYKNYYLAQNYYYAFRKKIVDTITKSRGLNSSSGRAITLVSKNIAGKEVALKIDGKIKIDGQIIFEEKDQIALNQKQNKSWDLDIEQSQNFNIEGTIGDKISIKANQDSEADFSFENDLKITYQGKKNDVMKKLEAGNIALHLPSSQFVNVGSSSSEGLFGIKMVHQLGPLAIQSIISREQVKKKTFNSDVLKSDGSINEYSYIRDKHFFIDEYFKAQYYPLDDLTNAHTILRLDQISYYTISEYELWKLAPYISDEGDNDGTHRMGIARVDPHNHNSETDYEGEWIRLDEITDTNEGGSYRINRILGTIELRNIRSTDIIAISYKIGKHNPTSPSDDKYETYSSNSTELNEIVNYFNQMNDPITKDEILDNGTTSATDNSSDLIMKLIKSTNRTSDPSSPTWNLMFKNVYSVGAPGIKISDLDLSIAYIGGNIEEQEYSEYSSKSFLEVFGLDRFNDLGELEPNGKIDYFSGNSTILNLSTGELFFPTYLPFGFDSTGRVNNNGDPIIGTNKSYWGPNPGTTEEPEKWVEDLQGYLTRINDSDNNFSDTEDDGPAMYYDFMNSKDIQTEHNFIIKVSGSQTAKSATYTLGFMIVENSEEVRLNGNLLTRDIDYILDSFGTLTMLNPLALDPTANIEISYEEQELVSFDQKLLAGIHLKLDLFDNDYISGGTYFYNQSIVDDKVEIGYEPMRNFLWNINGKYDTDINFLTKFTDRIPFVEANEKSYFSLEGEFAKVYPNPNPLGQAFIDDFESSKQTASPSILQNRWKLSSPPIFSATEELYPEGNTVNLPSSEEYVIHRYLDVAFTDSIVYAVDDPSSVTEIICDNNIDVCLAFVDNKLFYDTNYDIYGFKLSHQNCISEISGGTVVEGNNQLDLTDTSISSRTAIFDTFEEQSEYYYAYWGCINSGGNWNQEISACNEETSSNFSNFYISEPDGLSSFMEFEEILLDDCISFQEGDYFLTHVQSGNTSDSMVNTPYENQVESKLVLTPLKLKDRDPLYWYNPYNDWSTKDIWPNMSTSNRAQNSTTKTLWLSSTKNWGENSWNGISTAFYPGDYNQEKSKYLDLWVNTDSVLSTELTLNIDIGYINEDFNQNGILDSEDEPIYGDRGNGVLEEGEDIGIDGCSDEYEDGFGTCIEEEINGEIKTFTYWCEYMETLYVQEDGLQVPAMNDWDYLVTTGVVPRVNYNLCNELGMATDGNYIDPNRDNFSFNSDNCSFESDCDYQQINGGEGNGEVQGYFYPDSEDLDNDYMPDFKDDYFTYSFRPKINNSLLIEDTETGWKLFRINLSDFKRILPDSYSSVEWSDIRMMRLWVGYYREPEEYTQQEEGALEEDSLNLPKNKIGIAKVEIVGSQWEERGETSLEEINILDSYVVNSDFSISVINTDENYEYTSPIGVQGEYNKLQQIRLKEQSLVMDFEESGISNNQIMGIKKSLSYMSNDNKDNFLFYKKLKMFVNVQSQSSSEWNLNDNEDVSPCNNLGLDECSSLSNSCKYDEDIEECIDFYPVNLIFRLSQQTPTGDLEAYYEIKQPLYKGDEEDKGWDKRNHIDINIDELTAKKLDKDIFDEFEDLGEDGCADNFETGEVEQPCSDEINPNYTSGTDPNGDNYSDENTEGTQGNGIYNAGEPFTDNNFNQEYTPLPSNYNEEEDIYSWNTNLENICGDCSNLAIKGSPAINRIDYIFVGVSNESGSEIEGQIYLNELRVTDVKKDKGEAFRLSGSLNFSDLLTLSSQYSRQDAYFHPLQIRNKTGNAFSTNESFNVTTNFNADKFLPSMWGINIPMTFKYTLENNTPAVYPEEPDVFTNGPEEAPEEIKNLSKTLSLSTSYKKKVRSKNWLSRITLDKININYSIINKDKSSYSILSDIYLNQDLGLNYSYNFGNDNYIMPFSEDFLIYKLFVNMPLLKILTKPLMSRMKDTKIYYTPERFSTNMGISEGDQLKITRELDSTKTYNLDMNRSLSVTYNIFNDFKTVYDLSVGSDLNYNMVKNDWEKIDLLNNWDSGLKESYTQKFTNTYTPELFFWLRPSIKFTPTYSWVLGTPIDDILTSSIKNSTSLQTSFNLQPKDLVEIFYNPNIGKSSSKKKKRGRKSGIKNSKKREPIFKDINNSLLKTVFESVHKFASKFSKIQFSYNYNFNHEHSNILSNENIDYLFRLGLSKVPFSLVYSDIEGRVGGFYHSYSYDYGISIPSISITKSISLTSVSFDIDSSQSISSSNLPSSSKTINYFPLGVNGEKGVYLPTWGLTWSGLEKLTFIKNNFKSFSVSHNYQGKRVSTFQNGQLQKNNYSLIFSPFLKLNVKTKGKDPVTFEMGSKYSLDLFSEGNTIIHDINTKIWGTVKFSRSKGIYIPLFFFRDLDLNNNISFDMTVSFESDRKLASYEYIESKSDMILEDLSSKFSLNPRISYQFSQWVSGNIFYTYILSDDIITSKRKEQDFGFNLTIQIRG